MNQAQRNVKRIGSGPLPPRAGRGRSAIKLASAAGLSMAALVVAACGSAANPPTSSIVASKGPAPATGRIATTAGHNQRKLHRRAARNAGTHRATTHSRAQRNVTVAKSNEHLRPPVITRGHRIQRPANGTGGNAVNDDHPAPSAKASRADSGRPSVAGLPNPCDLVTTTEAQAFIGRSVRVLEAPLGPTCIYQQVGVKTPVTLSVQTAHFATLKAHIKNSLTATIAGRTAVCARYNSGSVTYVSLSGARVLNIGAPCAVGKKFAAAAVPRVGA